jgi:penicillin-binding protein 1A
MHENGYVDDTNWRWLWPICVPFGQRFPVSIGFDRDYFTAAIVNEVEDLFPDYDMDSAGRSVAIDEKRRRRVMPSAPIETYDRGIGRWRGWG